MWDAARAPSGRVLTQPGRAPSRRCLTLLGRKRQLSCVQRQLQGRVLLSHKRLQVQGKGHDILPDLKQRHTGDFRRHTGVKTNNGQTHCYPWAAPGQALLCVLTPRLATPSTPGRCAAGPTRPPPWGPQYFWNTLSTRSPPMR